MVTWLHGYMVGRQQRAVRLRAMSPCRHAAMQLCSHLLLNSRHAPRLDDDDREHQPDEHAETDQRK